MNEAKSSTVASFSSCRPQVFEFGGATGNRTTKTPQRCARLKKPGSGQVSKFAFFLGC